MTVLAWPESFTTRIKEGLKEGRSTRMKVFKELGVDFNRLVYSYRKFRRSALLWGATPAPLTEPGKLRHAVVGERRLVGWG